MFVDLNLLCYDGRQDCYSLGGQKDMPRILLTTSLMSFLLLYFPPPPPTPNFEACERLRVRLPDADELSCHITALDGGPPTYAQVHGLWYDDLPAPHTYGSMSYYSPGVFAKVVAPSNKLSAVDLSHEELKAYDGFIALADCRDVMRVVRITQEATGRVWRLLVADCAAHLWMDNGYVFLVLNGIIGEVDYETATEMGLVSGPRCCFSLEFE